VACDHPVRVGGAELRADALLARIPARAWQQISCGTGAKGHRYYDWAFIRLDHDRDPGPGEQHGQRWLMLRRNQRTGELAFYRCWMPRPVPLAILVRVAGTRWTVEERFQTGKGLVGLDQHQLRRWRSWYRWVTLAMLAHAFLVVAAVTERTRRPPPPGACPVDLQRGPAPARGSARRPGRRSRPPAALVGVATPTPGTRPQLPLPTARRPATMGAVRGRRSPLDSLQPRCCAVRQCEQMAADEREFLDFFADQYWPLRQVGFLLTGDWHEADELAQEAMARTYAAWGRVRQRDRAAAYARRVLVNRYRSLARRARVEARHLLASRPQDRYEPDFSGDGPVLWEALQRLPVRQRSAIVLRFYLDLPEAEVARLLGVPQGTVKSWTHRGLARLRVCLGSQYRHEPLQSGGEARP
jgi:RNA polymerase sigma-70 factor (sigma-E family)